MPYADSVGVGDALGQALRLLQGTACDCDFDARLCEDLYGWSRAVYVLASAVPVTLLCLTQNQHRATGQSCGVVSQFVPPITSLRNILSAVRPAGGAHDGLKFVCKSH